MLTTIPPDNHPVYIITDTHVGGQQQRWRRRRARRRLALQKLAGFDLILRNDIQNNDHPVFIITGTHIQHIIVL